MSSGIFSRALTKRRHRLKHKDLGLCVQCSNIAVKDKTLCLYHLLKRRKESYETILR